MYEDDWTTGSANAGARPWQGDVAPAQMGAAPAQMGAAPAARMKPVARPAPVGVPKMAPGGVPAAPQAVLGGKAMVWTPPVVAVPGAADMPPAAAAGPILEALRVAMQALQLTCGVSSELYVFPETRNLAGLRELHGQVLVPMSYHLVTAMGAGQIILAGNNRRSLWVLMFGCIMAAEQLSRAMPELIGRMQQAATTAGGPAIPAAAVSGAVQATQAWAARTMHALQRTFVVAQTALGQPAWTELAREAAELYRARTAA